MPAIYPIRLVHYYDYSTTTAIQSLPHCITIVGAIQNGTGMLLWSIDATAVTDSYPPGGFYGCRVLQMQTFLTIDVKCQTYLSSFEALYGRQITGIGSQRIFPRRCTADDFYQQVHDWYYATACDKQTGKGETFSEVITQAMSVTQRNLAAG